MRGRSYDAAEDRRRQHEPAEALRLGRDVDHGDDAGAADAEPEARLQEALELGRGGAGPRDDEIAHPFAAAEQCAAARSRRCAPATATERQDQRDVGEDDARRVVGEPRAEAGRRQGEGADEHDGQDQMLDEQQAVVDARDAAAGGEGAVPDEAGEHEQAHAGEQRAVRGHGLVRQARIEPAPVEQHLPGDETGDGRGEDVEQEEEAARKHPGVGAARIGLERARSAAPPPPGRARHTVLGRSA